MQTSRDRVIQMRIRERSKGRGKINSEKLLLNLTKDSRFDHMIANIKYSDNNYQKPKSIQMFGNPQEIKNLIPADPERRKILDKGVDIEIQEGFGETKASDVISREHELLGEKGKPSKKELKVHKQLVKEFDQ